MERATEQQTGREMITPSTGEPPVGAAEMARNAILTGQHELDRDDLNNLQLLDRMAIEFHRFIGNLGPGREFSLAKTNLEQAVMWARKGITG